MRLTATAAEPFATKHTVSSLVAESEADVPGLFDILSDRADESRLYRLTPVASDVPERSMQRVAAAAPDDGADWPRGFDKLAAAIPFRMNQTIAPGH